MKLFLANATVDSTPYMGERSTFQDVRLVWAEDAEEAREKYEAFWERECEEYSHSYTAHSVDITEAIE